MQPDFLHNHSEFKFLLQIIAEEMGIDPYLVEKDYWIMHVLYGLKELGLQLFLKGGTSLSKGYGIIERFSEDIDVFIKPKPEWQVDENPKHTKPKQVATRLKFYDELAGLITIDGITAIKRDTEFDDVVYYRSGGIRLYYTSHFPSVEGVKEGILLEVGFDVVAPNSPLTISSWAIAKALDSLGNQIINNRALEIKCYHPGYTFVEKLQTIATKYRQERDTGEEKQNFMRQYYDVSRLLLRQEVVSFIGTIEYQEHKNARFPKKDLEIPLAENEAFLLSDPAIRARFKVRYQSTAKLYFRGQPEFEEILTIIGQFINSL